MDLARGQLASEQRAALSLTPREREILASIDRGDSVKQTARSLGIAVKTVESLQGRLFRKLGVRNRAQAVAAAHTRGLLAAQ
jgi:DNA-binding CsgD family transcriptional regulator